MSAILILVIVGVGIGLLIALPIFLVAFIASQSRKKKRRKIIESLPAGVDFYAAVRVNSSKKNDAFFKLAAF